MERKIVKKILAVLMIIMIMSADFYVLGSNLITYALTLDNTTNHQNIEFSAYFKNEKGEITDKLQTSIKSENLKLYAEVTVKNEGYLNGVLELNNNNFNIKNNILSDSIESIDGNKVILKQINAGTKAEIELDIEPIISDTTNTEMLLNASELKLTGKYMETSYKGISIEATKLVTLNLQADTSAAAELETDIITNKIFSINGTNKRIVQLLVKSRLTDNQYPIRQTLINVNIPNLSEKQPEEVNVLSLGTMATNENNILTSESWKSENGNVQITLKNEDSEIKWNKDVYDELVVTFIYAEDVDASKIEIVTNSEITLHNSETKYTAQYTKGIENKEPNGIITVKSEVETKEIYKGQLYANINATEKHDVEYNTTTNLIITNENVSDIINIHEGLDTFITEGENLEANTKYISTKINKDKMLAIIGQDGNIEIKCGDQTTIINKDTEANESGNIEIKYTNASNEIDITVNNIENAGILEIQHSKAITENTYTREQLKTIKGVKTQVSVQATNNASEKIVENSAEASLELKETISKAELTVSKESLSTITTNEDVVIGIKLITDGLQYDLYKNPKIKIQLPSAVESINVNSTSVLYAEEFKSSAKYDSNSKIIEITLDGEQLEYPETSATQLYIQLNLDIILSKNAPSKTDKIIMTYTNENATQYAEGTAGIIEKETKIVSPSGLVAMNDIENYGVETIAGISEDKQLVTINKNNDAGKEVQFRIGLINNTNVTVNNIKILGNFPTDGNFTRGEEQITNNLTTTLKSAINATNCTIYYTSNLNATADVSDINNGWKQNLSEVQNPKAYLIEVASMAAETNFEATYTVQLPATLDYELTSYAGYEISYSEDGDASVQKLQSTLVGLTTGEVTKLETFVEATVGNDVIKDGDTIKNGEVIKYKVTTKNNGKQNLENVVVKAGVPTGTVVVVPEEDFVYSGFSYYEEKNDTTEITEIIPSLAAGQSYVTEYEVRVKMDTPNGTQISNKSTAIHGEVVVYSNEMKNIISEAKLRVTIKRVRDVGVTLAPNTTMEYLFMIENLSNEDVDNLKLKVMLENQKIIKIVDSDYKNMELSSDNEMTINKIQANGNIYFKAYTLISSENVDGINMCINVIDSNGNIFRSNRDGQNIEKIGATIELNSPTNGQYVKAGDEIIYNISINNTSSSGQSIVVEDHISEYLEIKEIYEDGQLKSQTTNDADESTFVEKIDNDFEYYTTIGVNETKVIKIVTEVKYTEMDVETELITSIARVLISGVEKDKSQEVTHTLMKTTIENNKNIICGVAWFDENQNGQKDSGEKLLQGIKAKLFDIKTNTIAKDKTGNNAETTTNDKGEYAFTKINKGEYIVLFEYDTTEYELTTYMKDGVQESQNSNVVLKTINLNGEEKACAVTDTIKVADNVYNINIGLKELLIYDMELDKFISKIVVQNDAGTKAYDYNESTFQKVEIHKKQINNSIVVLEYTIRIKNTGEIAGYVTSIKDYLPSGLEFSSELNTDWYLSGEDLYTKSLANERIEPGETKELKLILTKKMTENNVGLINNRAEIIDSYNEFGKTDIDSIANNEMKDEDDFGAADIIISISTGGTIIAYVILLMINTILITIAVYLIFIKYKRF